MFKKLFVVLVVMSAFCSSAFATKITLEYRDRDNIDFTCVVKMGKRSSYASFLHVDGCMYWSGGLFHMQAGVIIENLNWSDDERMKLVAHEIRHVFEGDFHEKGKGFRDDDLVGSEKYYPLAIQLLKDKEIEADEPK